MAKEDEFRDQAAACLDQSQRASNVKSKLELLAIAVAWLDLADLTEQSRVRATNVVALGVTYSPTINQVPLVPVRRDRSGAAAANG